MSAPVVIRTENLSKCYRISHLANQVTLRDAMHHSLRLLWRRLRWKTRLSREEFWALRDVNFEVRRGEVLGIIGRNGAGKSTLLKILSRITEPTAGRVTLHGRVASLLEVGTGFHPELTGRDNIFLNGAVLGMRRAEIRAKFDEIVAFAEVEKFIDTPVKRYSSGMYVRLAFAVAAHLEPEILIIDEVLAVGDAQFQKKCLGKLRFVTERSGRTVLFVSHDIAAVSSITQRCLLLDQGQTRALGSTTDMVDLYVGDIRGTTAFHRPAPPLEPAIISARIETSGPGAVQLPDQTLRIRIGVSHPQAIRGACLSIQIIGRALHPATHLWAFPPEVIFGTSSGQTELVCELPSVRLNIGHYHLRIFLSEPPGGRMLDSVEGVCSFDVVQPRRTVLWGWRPEVATYFEEHRWSTSPSGAP